MISKYRAAEIQAQIDKHNAWRGNRNGFNIADIPEGFESPSNADISALECFHWIDNPPDKYFLYVNDKKATTWTGDVLGTILFGRTWRSNMGDERVAITVFGTNGSKYFGTYYKSSGNYARIRRAKSLLEDRPLSGWNRDKGIVEAWK